MAALCPGVQYGLSSQQNFGENKDFIFVKLTDSALRAIEDYIKNQNQIHSDPTIKFLGNGGQLSFPSSQNGNTSFSFTMSTTADMEGPGGSFECVQQTGLPRGSLECLGSIPYKVRVNANEDVYETTRHRMTIAEENHKNKCTRVIKPNEKDIGRKVKLKITRGPLPPIRRDPPLPKDNQPKQSYQSNVPSKPIAAITSTNGLSNGAGSNHVSSSRPQLNKPSVPDIARRPIKERLIQLLALRPFKKVELHDRLTKEGVREKNAMTSILKQISFMKDNCYHLNRALWNEINEDWPFYTEAERQMLKRRKPQNLTPPGSSDGGSSGGGLSPPLPGSPPPIGSSTKRPGYYQDQDGMPTKRQRISHFLKPSEQNFRASSDNNNSQRRPPIDSRDASNMNPRSRESPTPMNNGGIIPTTNGVSDKGNFSDDVEVSNVSANGKRSCDSHSLSFGINRDKTLSAGGSGNSNECWSPNHKLAKVSEVEPQNGYVVGSGVPNGKSKMDFRDKDRNKYDQVVNSSNRPVRVSPDSNRPVRVSPDSNRPVRVSPDSSRPVRVSPDSQSDAFPMAKNDRGLALAPLSPRKPKNKVDGSAEFPDYLTEFTTIRDAEQRRKYKAHFNADYAEYKILHGIVEKVSRRFAELEFRLKNENSSSNKYKDIRKQIVREYNENKKDLKHQQSKRRFQYLHEKLSHIKRLVLEYDQGLSVTQY